MNPDLHIVSFDIPYPPNYGGIIDVFYKIRALHSAGVNISLHCFHYNRQAASELENYCVSVNYYPRKTGIAANLNFRPYIVNSRNSKELVSRLLRDKAPILLEGLHTCRLLEEKALSDRLLIYRESNIEHHYYYHLFLSEKRPWKKIFFLIESIRLTWYQKFLQKTSLILTVSVTDTWYLKKRFPDKKVVYLPSFHGHDEPGILTGKGEYVLYHGKLSVPENYQAVHFIIDKIWQDSLPELVIAGMDPPGWMQQAIHKKPNIRLVANPDHHEMEKLIREAQVNLMVTFQSTGLKLKLLHALFTGRHCLVNPLMTVGTDLGEVCNTAVSPDDFRSKIRQLFLIDFDEKMVESRKQLLSGHYSDRNNCKQLRDLLNLY